MTRSEFLNWVNKTHSNISASKNNLYPTDLCYNSYNAGLKDFPGPNLCLIYDFQNNKFRLVGTGYKYSGNIFQYYGKPNQRLVGRWRNGVCEMMDSTSLNMNIPENIQLRRDDLIDGLAMELHDTPVSLVKNGSSVEIRTQDSLLCGISVEENVYKIFNASSEWINITSYLCNQDNDGSWFYYLETIDECIGECRRLVLFITQKEQKGMSDVANHTSELYRIFTKDLFRKAYIDFIEQADKNAISKLAQGSKSIPGIHYPYGNTISGADVIRHFGQGAASNTPYINWWVVSVYYVVDQKKIVVGIEKNRYPHLVKMKPVRFEALGNRKTEVAIFYETSLADVDYDKLYESFITVAEEVMSLGLR